MVASKTYSKAIRKRKLNLLPYIFDKMSRRLWVLEKYARYKINKGYTGLGTENSTGSWQVRQICKFVTVN